MLLMVAVVSGCAGLLGPAEQAAPIEDRAQQRVDRPRPPAAPLRPSATAQPKSASRGAAVPGARRLPDTRATPGIAMPDKTPSLSLPAPTPLPPEAAEKNTPDGRAPGDEEIGASNALTRAAPALSPAVQSLVVAANTAAAQKNWDRAQAALERAVKLAPSQASVWRQLAYTHLQSGDLERAREVAQRALSLASADGRENVAVWRLIGDIEQARGDTAAAQAARTNAARLAQ